MSWLDRLILLTQTLMQTMTALLNSSISVDCAVFGFDGQALKILLIKCDMPDCEYKLPGSMIYESEEIREAANRVLEELTGLKDVYLKPFETFSNPSRITGSDEWQSLKDQFIDVFKRIVTI